VGVSVLNSQLKSKPDDGEQVEPASVESENFLVQKARELDRELARE